MTLCAGLCSFQSRSGFCSIRLSEPLLKYRPRSDMINTLLHEMIHAYVFIATSVRDHEDHGPVFQGHMNRINKAAQTKITIFHTFHEEVNFYRQHVWQCNGPCQRTPPYFGVVKRSMNRAPGPTDRWWADHEQKCGGRYLKIKEPAEFTAKQAKKMARKLACEEKQKKKQDKEAKTIPSVKEFFPTVEKDVMSMNLGNTTRGDAKAPCNGKKARCQAEIATDSNKKRKKERGGDSNSLDLPTLALPSSNPAIFSADADGLYLVGDIQALFQTPRLQLGNRIVREDDQEEAHTSPQSGKNTFLATTPTHAAGSSTVVDLTVSDSDASDNEQLDNAHLTTMSRASADSLPMTGSGKPKVIEIE